MGYPALGSFVGPAAARTAPLSLPGRLSAASRPPAGSSPVIQLNGCAIFECRCLHRCVPASRRLEHMYCHLQTRAATSHDRGKERKSRKTADRALKPSM
eukprot:scaffold106036_cov17-Prasinocladus_malaysianus.AAC.1